MSAACRSRVEMAIRSIAKVALVTGGASGIGAALVARLAEGGTSVIVADRNIEGLQGGAAERVRALQIDVSIPRQVDELFAMIDSAYGSLDLVINCAGICGYGQIAETTSDAWNNEINVNLRGTMAVSLAAYALMRRKGGGGAIVNMSSAASFIVSPLLVPYVTTKAAILAFSRALGIEAEAQGIYVGVVCPGNVKTPMLSSWRQSFFTPAITTDDAARRILKGVTRRRRIMVFPLYAKIFWYLDRLGSDLLNPLRRESLRRALERSRGGGQDHPKQ